jgi:hypothetical protein
LLFIPNKRPLDIGQPKVAGVFRSSTEVAGVSTNGRARNRQRLISVTYLKANLGLSVLTQLTTPPPDASIPAPTFADTSFYIFANVRTAATTLLPKQGFGMNSMGQSIISRRLGESDVAQTGRFMIGKV